MIREGHGSEPRDIVVGVDGSPASHEALRWALGQARLTGTGIHAVTAWEFPPVWGWGVPAVPYQNFDVAAQEILEKAVAEALGPEPGVPVRTSVVSGHPAQVLLDAAREADLLVVGSRGHGAFAGTLLGSVSQRCAAHSHCPVVVVR
ncbi:universal stress protein [Actinoplanes sp. NBRC 14428]|uniref:Nucleotide-binding universal stress UspA family protein n=1 Tax=Pseudosporangium ferrugineum TaxID=439699 RepID=A0A2T0SHP0_9ACTN|nr:universal stress protein [Pseudosporangium ferrugineum]PRY32926.1 nucleotide-binding universal stress UspA family protein [Pseudosporangium ferrugineum]BCJ49113.1 universal stress protein [Actinoplanes sp. NBRC 14428]